MFPEGRILDFLIVGVVALIVVGPKDLPLLMRKVGQFVARMRGMAAEFRASFDEMARQSELDELRREVDAMRAAHTGDLPTVATLADPHTQQVFDDIHAGLHDAPLTSSHGEMAAEGGEGGSSDAPSEAASPSTAEPVLGRALRATRGRSPSPKGGGKRKISTVKATP